MNASQAARIGAHALHAQGKTNTAPARAAFEAKFVAQVDPHGVLSPQELAKRVAHAKSEYFTRLRHMSRRNAMNDVQSGEVWPEEEE